MKLVATAPLTLPFAERPVLSSVTVMLTEAILNFSSYICASKKIRQQWINLWNRPRALVHQILNAAQTTPPTPAGLAKTTRETCHSAAIHAASGKSARLDPRAKKTGGGNPRPSPFRSLDVS
jgi:hypothetical protein